MSSPVTLKQLEAFTVGELEELEVQVAAVLHERYLRVEADQRVADAWWSFNDRMDRRLVDLLEVRAWGAHLDGRVDTEIGYLAACLGESDAEHRRYCRARGLASNRRDRKSLRAVSPARPAGS